MVMRVGGLASGMDIDAIVEKLMMAEKTPVNKLQQQKTAYEWQRDAYREVNTKIKTLDTYISDNLVLKTLNSKTATSSNSSLVGVVATGSATGMLSIEGVSQLATNARAVGKQINATSSTKMTDIPGVSAGTIEIKAIQANGELAKEATKIEITEDMTVSQFVSKLNASNAGVSAVFENGRFSLTAKNAGDIKGEEEIQIINDEGQDIFKSLGFFEDTDGNPTTTLQTTDGKNARFSINGIATERSTNKFTINGYSVELKSTFNEAVTHGKFVDATNTGLINSTATLNNLLSEFAEVNKYNVSPLTGDLSQNLSTVKDAIDLKISMQQGAVNALADKKNVLIGDKTAGAIYNSLSSRAKEFLTASTASDINEFMTSINNVTDSNILTFADKTALQGLADFQAVKDAGIQIKNEVAFNSLSEKAKSFLTASSQTDQASFEQAINGVTDDSILTESDKTALKALANFEETRDAAISLQNKAAYNALSQKAKEFLASSTAPDKASFDAAIDNVTDNDILTEADKTALKNLQYGMVSDLQAMHANETELAARTAELNVTKADATRLSNTVDAYNNAQRTANTAGDVPATTITAPEVTLNSTTDVDAMMTKIKDFVTTYNAFVKELSDKTKETKYRDYAPLTEDQKKEMEDDEIKLWEEKAKSGLLRSDSLIQNGLSSMRGLVYETHYGVDNQKYNSLYSVGIGTSKNYNDGGTLEIDEAKLRKAIEEDPNAVEQLFKNTAGSKTATVTYTATENGQQVTKTKQADTRGFLYQLRDSMKQFEISIEKKAGRSTMTDAQYTLGKTLTDMGKRLDTWEDKLKTIEERYWKQFTAMETAINTANQQSSLFMQ